MVPNPTRLPIEFWGTIPSFIETTWGNLLHSCFRLLNSYHPHCNVTRSWNLWSFWHVAVILHFLLMFLCVLRILTTNSLPVPAVSFSYCFIVNIFHHFNNFYLYGCFPALYYFGMTAYQLIILALVQKYPSIHDRPLGGKNISGISELDSLNCKSKYECEWLIVLLPEQYHLSIH